MVLGLRGLHHAGNKKLTDCHTGHSLRQRDLKVSDTLPPTRPHLLIVPLTLGVIFFQITTHYDEIIDLWRNKVVFVFLVVYVSGLGLKPLE